MRLASDRLPASAGQSGVAQGPAKPEALQSPATGASTIDPQDLITRFLDTTREASTRAADVEAIKDLLVGLPAGHPIGLQAADALRQVFLDPTEAAEVRQAVTQAFDSLPHQWY